MSHEQERTISPSCQDKVGQRKDSSGYAAKGASSPSLSSLSKRLQANSKKEQQLIEDTVQDGLQKQRAALQDLITREQKAIERVIIEQRTFLQRALKWEWIIQLLLGLGLTLGVIVGSWGWTEYQISRLTDAQNELARVQSILAREKPLLSRMELYPAPNGGIWVRVKSRENWIEAVPLKGVRGTYVEALVRRDK